MIVFGLSGPKLVPIPNFSSISLRMADFSLFFGVKSCKVPSVIFLPWQQFKILTNWFDLQNVSQNCIFKVRKFQLDTLSRFRMVKQKQEGGAYFAPPRVR